MISITVNLLGGLHTKLDVPGFILNFPEGSTIKDLEVNLNELDIDTHSNDIIISVSGRGLHQCSPDQPLRVEDEIFIFPNIAGG